MRFQVPARSEFSNEKVPDSGLDPGIWDFYILNKAKWVNFYWRLRMTMFKYFDLLHQYTIKHHLSSFVSVAEVAKYCGISSPKVVSKHLLLYAAI